MNQQPNLPPQSQGWGRDLAALIDDTSNEIASVSSGIGARLSGLSVAAQSLVGQADMVESAISNTQPVRIEISEVFGLIVNPDPAPVTKATIIIPLPEGYNSVMFQAHGNGYVQQPISGAFPVESQFVVSAPGATTVTSETQYSPFQDSAGIRYFKVAPSYTAFMPGMTGSLNVQLQMRTRGGVSLNNGANSVALIVMANFYKGTVLLPPA